VAEDDTERHLILAPHLVREGALVSGLLSSKIGGRYKDDSPSPPQPLASGFLIENEWYRSVGIGWVPGGPHVGCIFFCILDPFE
jgi:hypothetical protein